MGENTAPTELPIACTLGPDGGALRLQRWERLHRDAAPRVHLAPGRLEIRYRPGLGVLEELRGLAAAEQSCCAFVEWSVADDDGIPTLRVEAPPDAPGAIAPILAAFGVAPGE